jgi:LmbE family N-acetylglucosaminyl deacetylase
VELKLETRTPQRVLAIVAHPDDIEFGMAGSIAHWIDAGATVTYCIITDGAAGSNEPDTDLAELARTREAEQRAAAAALGVTDVRFLGYHDGTLEPTIALRRDLTRIIRELRPDRVVTMDPTTLFARDTYINHPDHRAAGEAAVYATFPSAGSRPIFPELLAEGLEPHNVTDLYMVLSETPDLAIDITPTFERKMAALLAHKSQLGEDVAEWIREMNAEIGKLAGVELAEAFRVIHLAHDEVQEAQAADLNTDQPSG